MNPIYDVVRGAAAETVGKVFSRLSDLIPAGAEKRAELEAKARELALEEARTQAALALQEDDSLRGFMLAYEGRAETLPLAVQVLRASVRPILSYLLVASTAWLVWNGRAIPVELHQLDLLCLAFWFGERAVRGFLRTRQGRDDG